jgi:response regulator RpfG family c-di-GMP phosphodiesterase
MYLLEHGEFDIRFAGSGNDAIKFLENNKVDIVICDYNMPNGNGGDVYSYLLNNNIDTKYVLCSSDRPTQHEIFKDERYLFGNIEKPAISKGIELIIQKLMSVSDFNISRDNDLSQVPINLLYKLGIVPSDVFIRIGENKVIKILNKGETFDSVDLVKYQQKLIRLLLIEKMSFEQFKKSIEQHIFTDLKNSRDFNNYANGLGLLNEYISEYGFNSNLNDIISTGAATMVDALEKNKQLGLLFSQLVGNKNSYRSKHSMLLSVFCPLIAKKLKWSNRIMDEKLIIASLFHDITLKDDDIETTNIGKLLSVDNFMNHSYEAAEIIRKVDNVPPDTHVIIMEHHEGGEKGIPKGTSYNKISPLGLLFGFCHKFVDQLILTSSPDEALDNMKIYSEDCSQYRIFYKALESLDIY